jgi:hypothetical protein
LKEDLTMPWEPERNRRSLSPHGLKEAEGHAAPGVHDMHNVGCSEMPPGLLSMQPIGPGVSSPYMPSSSRSPRGEPTATTVPHARGPHDRLHPIPRDLASKGR